jgi:hypothetical protein
MRAFRSSQAVDAVPLAAGDIHLAELAVSHLPGLGLSGVFLWRHCLSRTADP